MIVPLVLVGLTGCPGAFYFGDSEADGGSCGGHACAPGLVCSAASTCVECASKADCSAPMGQCLLTSARCVECLVDADCGAGRVCEPTTHHCLQRCREDNECVSDKCAQSRSPAICIDCSAAGDCPAAFGVPVCDPQRGTCVRCVEDSQCSGGQRCDRITGSCRECVSAADCDGGACGRDGRCIRGT